MKHGMEDMILSLKKEWNGKIPDIGGGAVKLTTAQIYWPNGACNHGVGNTENDSDAGGSPQTVAAETNADYNNAALTAMLASIAAR